MFKDEDWQFCKSNITVILLNFNLLRAFNSFKDFNASVTEK